MLRSPISRTATYLPSRASQGATCLREATSARQAGGSCPTLPPASVRLSLGTAFSERASMPVAVGLVMEPAVDPSRLLLVKLGR